MNDTQIIFTVFFAIAWGTMSSALPKWKAFHWTLFFQVKQVWHRVILSMILLNALPVIFFGWTLLQLSDQDYVVNNWSTRIVFLQVIIHGVFPAAAAFGFYRLWIAIVEFKPKCFYKSENDLPEDLRGIEPTIEEHNLESRMRRSTKYSNLFFAVLYIGIAVLAPYV